MKEYDPIHMWENGIHSINSSSQVARQVKGAQSQWYGNKIFEAYMSHDYDDVVVMTIF